MAAAANQLVATRDRTVIFPQLPNRTDWTLLLSSGFRIQEVSQQPTLTLHYCFTVQLQC